MATVFKNFSMPSIMYGVGRRVFQGNNQYFVDLHKTGTWFESIINPSTYPHWERAFLNPDRKTFLIL